jgi:hypothetical protein
VGAGEAAQDDLVEPPTVGVDDVPIRQVACGWHAHGAVAVGMFLIG